MIGRSGIDRDGVICDRTEPIERARMIATTAIEHIGDRMTNPFKHVGTWNRYCPPNFFNQDSEFWRTADGGSMDKDLLKLSMAFALLPAMA
jgi:hypothetical protein